MIAVAFAESVAWTGKSRVCSSLVQVVTDKALVYFREGNSDVIRNFA